jgi:GTPase SAR1 family protein
MTDNIEREQELELHFKGIRLEIERILKEASSLAARIGKRRHGYSWGEEFSEQIRKTNEKWASQSFQVAVVALMKSGKSTLINACLGNEFLPAGVLAETARIVRIRHTPTNQTGALIQDSQLLREGAEDIQTFLREINREARENNKNPEEDEIILEAPLVPLAGKSLGKHGFEILDTPGPNEQGINALRHKVERLLKDIDVVIYVLDVTKLKTVDEARIFENLAQRKDLMRNLSRRLFFVVNKIDALTRHDRLQKLTPQEIAQHVVDTLRRQIEGIEITTDQVFLISAENALLARLIESGHASKEQLRDFNERAFGDEWDEDDPPSLEESQARAPRRLKKSGLPQLERRIITFLYEQRTSILFGSVVDELDRILKQVDNNLELGRATLFANREKINLLQDDINKIRKGLEGITNIPQKYEKKTVKQINHEFDEFKARIDKTIVYFFSEEKTAERAGLLAAFLPKTITDLVGATKFEVASTEREVVLKNIKKLNEEIFNYLDGEFNNFWNEMVNNLKRSYDELSDELTAAINPLKQRIEEKINETLNINLQFSSVKAEKLTLNEFYLRIQEDAGNFIRSKEEINPRFEKKTYKFKGWSVFGFRVFKPRQVDIPVIRMKETTFYASSKRYQAFLKEQIDPVIERSKALSKEIIDKQYLRVVEDARKVLNRYADRYIRIMKEEIVSHGNPDKVNLRIKEIEGDIVVVNQLIAAAGACIDILAEEKNI